MANAATAQGEAGKIVEEKFEADFFQGYVDLRRWVAVDHSKWDLVAYSRADSDFLEVEC